MESRKTDITCHPLCAVAGAIDRIFGLNQAIKCLDDVSEAAMTEKYQVFCRLCGSYRPIRESSRTLISPVWRKALASCHARVGCDSMVN